MLFDLAQPGAIDALMADIEAATWFCPFCSHPNDREAGACHVCGIENEDLWQAEEDDHAPRA